MIIVNADDWGRSREETDVTLQFYRAKRITAVSAMVYMQDSARAAELALQAGVDVGLHVNLTQRFDGPGVPAGLVSDHDRVATFLWRHSYAQLVYHPGLRSHFREVYEAQAAEFERLYGSPPSHVDGHRHMHLSSNMLLDGIIPRGHRVRRSFSFWPGEKGLLNRTYRHFVDWRLSTRYRTTDYFFVLSQYSQPHRLQRVSALARTAKIEMMTHPAIPAETAMLESEEFGRFLDQVEVGTFAAV